jgi:hypothetical protein
MSYATDDFVESIRRVAIRPDEVQSVVAAWGKGDGQGTDDGHYRWGNSATEWSGGFLMHLKNGRFAYLTGWCDYTGWGCQDGAELSYFDTKPVLDALLKLDDPAPEEWDHEPADLNRWLSSPDTENCD